ncbi:hypothetical protein [Spiroplasma endosymbiont of Aspidapion aeneum]|uniref:hypothetical protein n=1 Tax=Spiroplasma endosymbiont of Aspidapion aeneum TaxID=3066276 RepID=UPI00313EF73B
MINKEYESPWFKLDDYLNENRYGIQKLIGLPSKWRNEFSTLDEMWSTITIDIQYCINLYFINFFDHVNFSNLNSKLKRMIKNCLFYTFTSILYGKLPVQSNVVTNYSDTDGYSYNSSYKYDNRDYKDIFSPTALKSLELTNIRPAMNLYNDPIQVNQYLNTLNYDDVVLLSQLKEFENEVHSELDLIYEEIDIEILEKFDSLKRDSNFIKDFVDIAETPLEERLSVNKILNENLQNNALNNSNWNAKLEIKLQELLDNDKQFQTSLENAIDKLLEKDSQFIKNVALNKDLQELLKKNILSDKEFKKLLSEQAGAILAKDSDFINAIALNDALTNYVIKNVSKKIDDLLNASFVNLIKNTKIDTMNNLTLQNYIDVILPIGVILPFDTSITPDPEYWEIVNTSFNDGYGWTLISSPGHVGESNGRVANHLHTITDVSHSHINFFSYSSQGGQVVYSDEIQDGSSNLGGLSSGQSNAHLAHGTAIQESLSGIKQTNWIFGDYSSDNDRWNEKNYPAGLYVHFYKKIK